MEAFATFKLTSLTKLYCLLTVIGLFAHKEGQVVLAPSISTFFPHGWQPFRGKGRNRLQQDFMILQVKTKCFYFEDDREIK